MLNEYSIQITGGFNSKRHVSTKLKSRHINYLLPFFKLNTKLLNDSIEHEPLKDVPLVEYKDLNNLTIEGVEKKYY